MFLSQLLMLCIYMHMSIVDIYVTDQLLQTYTTHVSFLANQLSRQKNVGIFRSEVDLSTHIQELAVLPAPSIIIDAILGIFQAGRYFHLLCTCISERKLLFFTSP